VTLRSIRFGPVEVEYDDGSLEPRPWTLAQARWAGELLAGCPEGAVLELCAGAGQIGLVVAVESGRPLVQVDVDRRACDHARRNASRAGVVTDVRCGELDGALGPGERFPLVLADPPYVPSDDVDELPDDPEHAIDGGEDGLEVARTCVGVAAAHLVDGGLAIVQLGSAGQASALGGQAAALGLEVVETRVVGDEGALLLLRQPGP
jgi:methylase of polypeptide subunit release factors